MFLGVCALLACVPRLIWLMCEGGLMSFLTKGTGSKLVEHSREKREILLDAFTKHLKNRYNCYALTFFICETLNLVVLMVLFYLTDEFLQNQVRGVQTRALDENWCVLHSTCGLHHYVYTPPYLAKRRQGHQTPLSHRPLGIHYWLLAELTEGFPVVHSKGYWFQELLWDAILRLGCKSERRKEHQLFSST